MSESKLSGSGAVKLVIEYELLIGVDAEEEIVDQLFANAVPRINYVLDRAAGDVLARRFKAIGIEPLNPLNRRF